MSHHKLSFWTAILVNINVMLGAGYFINTVTLAKIAGFFGFLSYLLVAVLLIPLIICTARLLQLFPDGGFYVYASKSISQYAGFLSSWAYFTGKLASASLLVHVFSSLIVALFPALAVINIFVLDSIIIMLFAWLTIIHMRTGRVLLYTFMMFKTVPLLFVIISCLYLYTYWSIPAGSLLISGIPTTIPLVLFAFTGFEACCSLSGSLENAKKNGPLVVFLTYGFVVLLTIAYQLFFFLTAGKALMAQNNYLNVFPTLFSILAPQQPFIANHSITLLHIALACASLGGSYGILLSNHWNLYALAKHGHTFFAQNLARLNEYGIPTVCIIVEAIIAIFYLFFTQGTVVILQQISVLGSTLAYTLSIAGLLVIAYRAKDLWTGLLALFGLLSCFLFVSACIRNFYLHGLHALYLFGALLIFGVGMFLIKKRMQKA